MKTIKKIKLKRKKTGLPPGSIVFTGQRKVENVFIHYLKYSVDFLKDISFDNVSTYNFEKSTEESLDWYDIRGVHDTHLIERIGQNFNIHPLILEDIADINQRPKYEEYDSGIYVVVRAFTFDKSTFEVKTEQVSLFFTKGLLISFQETSSDLFIQVRERIKNTIGRIRSRDSDYLAYTLIDNMVDHYFVILDEIEEVIENLEDQILIEPDSNIKSKIHHLKKELLVVRKSTSPLREAINRFSKAENGIIEERTLIFIRDLYDHTIQLLELVDTYRDMLNGLQDLYLSEISFKMNQVMQVLTLIATIFIPLTFLAGIYGMNFEYMPELAWKYSYFVLLGTMAILFVGLIIFFKKRNWI